MNSLDVRTGALPRASVDIPKTFVAEWTVGNREVCLFQTSDRLAFSTEGRTGRLTPFRPELYDIGYAINLIIMFRRTIAVNLEKEEPHSSCFLPKFCTVARDAPEIHVALFGRVDTRSSITGELKGMRWGIFDTSRREEQILEVNDAVAEELVRHAPKTNVPHFVPYEKDGKPILDENKQPLMRQANDHYAMTSYAKRFDVVLERDADVIRNIRLVRTSIFDKNVWLDERSWAITLVSAQTTTSNDLATRTGCRQGHAVIAYEGVKKNYTGMRQFLSYIHIRAQPKKWIENITGTQAEVEILDDETYPHLKWEVLVGPTLSRSSIDVERMITSATQNGNVDFSLLGTTEVPTITGGGGLGVLAVAGLAMSCFNRATQIASNTLHASRAVISWVTGQQLPAVIKAAVIPEKFNNIIGALGIIGNGVSLEIFKRNVALARSFAEVHCALGLLIMYFTYKVAKSRSNRQNCLDWTVRTASLGGIIIRDVPSTVITPNETMLYLRSHPFCIEIVQANSEVGSSNASLGSGEKDVI